MFTNRISRTIGTLIPVVIEKTGQGERGWDIYSRLLKERIVFLGDEISSGQANLIMAQLLYLQFESKDKEISLYVNSPGGSITDGLAVYDTLQFVSPPVATYCLGQAAGLSVLLLASGTKGMRYALPNARILLQQPWLGAQGTTADIEIQAREVSRLKREVNTLLAKHTGQPLKRIEADTDRDFFLSAHQAKEYGIVDHVVDLAQAK